MIIQKFGLKSIKSVDLIIDNTEIRSQILLILKICGLLITDLVILYRYFLF